MTGELACGEAGVNLKGRSGGNNSHIMSWLQMPSAGMERSRMHFENAVVAISSPTGDPDLGSQDAARGTPSKFSKSDHLGTWRFGDWPRAASGDRRD